MAIIEDTNPKLGGNLDLNNFNILGTGSVNVIGSGNYSQGLYVNSTGVSLSNHAHSSLATNLDLNSFNINGTGSVNVIGSGNFSNGLYVNSTGVALTGHTHETSSITNFNSSVSGLLSVVNVVGSGNINVSSSNKTFTVSSTGLIKSDITTTSGAAVVNNIVVISEASYNALSVKDSNTIYFVT